MKTETVLSARGITKRFGRIMANDGIDLDLRKGEIHALLGENGAGKSTLMNILYGLCRPDRGTLFYGGDPVTIRTPREAMALGIYMVHQHFMLVPVFSVAENVVLGMEPARKGCLDRQAAREEVRRLSFENGLDIDPDAPVETLPVGMQQRVEILKALYRRAKILILDEPTAVLAPGEITGLFRILRRLARQQVACVLITHKLGEVMAVADRISVLRRGRCAGATTPSQTSETELAEMMIGRSVVPPPSPESPGPGKTVLRVSGMTVRDDRGMKALTDLSIQVRAGEIVGIAGVQGNGQRELAEVLAGMRPRESGRVILEGRPMPAGDPRAMIAAGMAHIPEDRHRHGLVLSYSVADNQVLSTYYLPPFARRLIRRPKKVLAHSRRLIDRFNLRVPGPLAAAAGLSGGNQQQLVVSRELGRDVRFLLANRPTRGLDVGAMAGIHSRILALRDHGAAVILISSELDELLALCDRIAVLYRGRIVAETAAGEVDRTQLGLLMTRGAGKNATPANAFNSKQEVNDEHIPGVHDRRQRRRGPADRP